MRRLALSVVLLLALTVTATAAQDGRDTFTGVIRQDDAPCSSGSPCKEYPLALHRDGTVDATLTWTDDTTWLWLELYKADGTLVAQSAQSRLAGLSQHINADVTAGSRFTLRVEWAAGDNPTPFTLNVMRPN